MQPAELETRIPPTLVLFEADAATFLVSSSPACLPLPTSRRHEIKHDGYRLMARRDPVGIRLLTRRGNDWSERFPRVVEAVNLLRVRSCLIDGEVVCCNDEGVAEFQQLRQKR